MYTISCFADEIAQDLATQIRTMKKHNIHYLSLRTVDGINVMNLTNEQLDTIAATLKENNICVSSIGSPIGKSQILDQSGSYHKQTIRAIEIAKKLECSIIRVFSFYMTDTEPAAARSEILRRLREMSELAFANGIMLVHENEADIYGESSLHCRDLLESIDMPSFRAAFDPSNFVAAGEEPFIQSLPNVKDYVSYLHIKDSRHSDGVIVKAGEGDAQIADILVALKDRDLFLTLEPHLFFAGHSHGFTGELLFEQAYNALTDILKLHNLQYK